MKGSLSFGIPIPLSLIESVILFFPFFKVISSFVAPYFIEFSIKFEIAILRSVLSPFIMYSSSSMFKSIEIFFVYFSKRVKTIS